MNYQSNTELWYEKKFIDRQNKARKNKSDKEKILLNYKK